MWFGEGAIAYEPAPTWTDEFLDWDTKADLSRPRDARERGLDHDPRRGRVRAALLGGCLETICWHLKGSSDWIDPEGAILLLETSEEAPSPGDVDAYLTDLEQLGVFDAAAGARRRAAVRLHAESAQVAVGRRRRAHRGAPACRCSRTSRPATPTR